MRCQKKKHFLVTKYSVVSNSAKKNIYLGIKYTKISIKFIQRMYHIHILYELRKWLLIGHSMHLLEGVVVRNESKFTYS